MRILSPDGFLIGTFERLFTDPQRRGVPLPALLVRTEHAPATAAMLSGLGSTLVASWWITIAWGCVFLAFAAYAYASALELRADAEHWDPALVRTYRAEAASMRAGLWPLRACILLAVLLSAAGSALTASALGPLSQAAFSLATLTVQMASLLAMLLARCVMPIEPDADSVMRSARPIEA
jgi:hypothetical protein